MSPSGRVSVGHPVDVATGVLFNTWLDFAIPGTLPLVFERFYSTALITHTAEAPLGPGWRHGFQHELRQTLEGFAYLDPQGVEHPLEDSKGIFDTTGKLLSPAHQMELRGTRDDLELQHYGGPHPQWIFHFRRRPKSTRYRLESLGLSPQARLRFEYSSTGLLKRILHTRSGRALRLESTPQGRLLAVWFEGPPKELVARYTYDVRGNLIQVTDRIGVVADYGYDAHHRMLSEAKATGAVYTFRHDVEGRCIQASGTDRFEERLLRYDPARRITEVSDSHGERTRYEYNEAGQVTSLLTPLGTHAAYTFDDLGRLVAITDVNGNRSTLRYDEAGHPCAASYPDGRELCIEYDDRHRPVKFTDHSGKSWRYAHDAWGCLVHSINPLGHEWRYEYNASCELVRIINPLGAMTQHLWDSHGNLQQTLDPDGHAWSAEHDGYGRLTRLRDPSGGTSRTTYDRAGNVESFEDPNGQVVHFEYDAGGRQTLSRDATGRTARRRYNACGQVIEAVQTDGTRLHFEWDTEPGRILSITDPRGNQLQWFYDVLGRPIERRHWDGTAMKYEFDAAGNLVAVEDTTGSRVEYGYDSWHNLVKRRMPDGAETVYTYDANCLPICIRTDEAELRFERDLYGRVTAEIQAGHTVRSTFDATGRRISLESDLGAQARFDWSPGGRCTSVQHAHNTLRFHHDARGREVRRELPGGGAYEQRHDAGGRVLEQWYVAPNNGVRRPGRATASPSAPASVHRKYHYNTSGHLDFVEDSMRGSARFVHDLLGHLQAAIPTQGLAELFEYDAGGNRRHTARLPSARLKDPESMLVHGTLGPDTLDLAELHAKGAQVEERLTAQGNRTLHLNRPGEHIRYEYDAQGRLARKHVDQDSAEGVAAWTYEWNALGQLRGIVRPDGERWSYDYDAMGRRVAKHGPRGTHRYVWDDARLLHEVTPSQQRVTFLTHPEQATPLLRADDTATFYALHDALGSTSEWVTEDGGIAWSARRGSWGEPLEQTFDGAPGFPGQSYDPESGLYYNFARYYDPVLGRYISPDPIGVLGGFNEYAYVPSPVEWMDVLGLYTTGGPFQWSPAATSGSGAPDLLGQGQRYVINPATGNRVTVPSPTDGRGGKCLAVMHGMPGGPQAFVSGHGNPNALGGGSTLPQNWQARLNMEPQFGNWCHSEIQALNHLRQNAGSIPPGGVDLYIDRPPCTTGSKGGCNEALGHILPDFDGKVRVHFWNHETGQYDQYHPHNHTTGANPQPC